MLARCCCCCRLRRQRVLARPAPLARQLAGRLHLKLLLDCGEVKPAGPEAYRHRPRCRTPGSQPHHAIQASAVIPAAAVVRPCYPSSAAHLHEVIAQLAPHVDGEVIVAVRIVQRHVVPQVVHVGVVILVDAAGVDLDKSVYVCGGYGTVNLRFRPIHCTNMLKMRTGQQYRTTAFPASPRIPRSINQLLPLLATCPSWPHLSEFPPAPASPHSSRPRA